MKNKIGSHLRNVLYVPWKTTGLRVESDPDVRIASLIGFCGSYILNTCTYISFILPSYHIDMSFNKNRSIWDIMANKNYVMKNVI